LDSGDLGLMRDGCVFVTGRTKDLLIRGGVKFSPAEIEAVVVREAGGAASRAVAFQVEAGQGVSGNRDRIIVAVETRRLGKDQKDTARLRAAVLADLGVAVDEIAFVAPGSIPRTTSGKLQRQRARSLWLSGELELGKPDPGGAVPAGERCGAE
jgi:acyl-CoA synthetase (AMP-forming)/AMP-acid ligase II